VKDADAGRGDAATIQAANIEATGKGLLNPADKVVIAYLIIIAALILIFSYRIALWPLLISAHAAAIIMVAIIAKWERASFRRRASLSAYRFRLSQFIRGWYPVALIPATFKELSYLIPLIHPRDFDAELAAIDFRMFGAHPTLWLERATWPPLTEILQIIYATYYFWPIALGALLWRKRQFDRYHFWVFVVAFGFYLSYLGYLMVPATGPRFLPLIKDAQSKPLAGLWIYQTIRETLDKAEGITRDCFPSGHTEMTLLAIYYARKFHRPMFWWMIAPGSALIISTVYLRYHYVIDVFAGALAALIVILAAAPLYEALGGNMRESASGRE
jgi:membrane-associated phospholipid phosphatase